MAFPLDKQSKFMGILDVTDFFVLLVLGLFNLAFGFCLVFFLHLALNAVLIICFSWYTVASIFIYLKGHYPPGFFVNRFFWAFGPKRYLPIPEPSELPDEK